MTLPRRTTLICPNCGNEVEANVLVSTNTFGGLTTDLHRLAGGAEPLEYLIHSCQNCGFTGGAGEFQGNVASNIAAQIKEFVLPHVRDERLKADARWEFAAQIAEWRQQIPEVVAQFYLNAAWCADEPDKEHYYRRRAADWFEQALDVGVENRPVILYLVGELYRRVGDTEVAIHWFDEAIAEADAEADKDPNAARIKEIAIQQKTNPQEMIQN
jgi:uncharacterized protein